MNRKSQVFLCLLLVAAEAGAQTVLESFDGDHGPGAIVCDTGVTHCGIPESDVAVNGKQVVQITWQNVRVYDYRGHLLRSTPTTTFVRNAGLNPIPPEPPRKPTGPSVRGPYEPHIVFDEFIGRWIITITGLSDSMLVSASSDPMGAWGGVNLSCLKGGPCLDFDPALHVGFDKNGVYMCGGHMGDSNPHTVQGVSYDCFAVPAAEAAAIAGGTAPAHINRAHDMPLDIIPAIDHNPSKAANAPAMFASKSCDRSSLGACQNSMHYAFHWVVETFTWNGVTGTYNADGEQAVMTDVGSRQNKWFYSKPCCGPTGVIAQAGNNTIGLRGVESHRLVNLVQHGSHLQGVLGSGPCTSDCGSQGTDTNNIMFWFDLDCTKISACVVSQTAKISGDFNPTYATVGVDASGNVGIVAESWTPSTNLSVFLWTRKTSDPPNRFNGPTTVVTGTQPYTCDTTKAFATIGNAAGILTALDPADGTRLWTSQQWANDATRCVWNTRIVEYQITGAGPAGKSKPKHKP